MERELWKLLCHLAHKLYNRIPRGRYGDDEVVCIYFWSVIHDRPVCWSCHPAQWPPELCPRYLPSQSTMSRRMRSAGVQQLMHAMEQHLLALTAASRLWVRVIDAKALPIGGHTKDPDAQWGRGTAGIQRGYKFYAVWGEGPLPIAWDIAAMNVSERRIAEQLIGSLPGGGYLLGDKHYDTNRLYDVAAAAGYQLVAQRWSRGGLGHHRHSPHRLRSLELLERPFGKALYRLRLRIEHCFAGLGSFTGGLEPLPFWVRRLHRVRAWLQAKLLINAVRILRRTQIGLAIA